MFFDRLCLQEEILCVLLVDPFCASHKDHFGTACLLVRVADEIHFCDSSQQQHGNVSGRVDDEDKWTMLQSVICYC